MDEISVKIEKENLFQKGKEPSRHQGKILVFDIVKKTKPLPFEIHIDVRRVNQREEKKEPLIQKTSSLSNDFIKIEKKQKPAFLAPESSATSDNQQAKKTDVSAIDKNKAQYKITGQKTFNFRDFSVSIKFGIMALMIILTVPLGAKINEANLTKAFIKNQGAMALSDFALASLAIENKNFSQAAVSFSSALEKFSQAQQSIQNLGEATVFLLASLPGISNQFSQGEKLIAAAKNLTQIGQIFSSLLEKITILNKEPIVFSSIFPQFKKLSTLLKETNNLLKQIDFASLPPPINSYQQKIDEIIAPFNYLSESLENFLPFLEEALGVDNPRKYIIIFQNPSEIRPTGGFIGSYALVDIDDGLIKNFKIDDVYNIDGQLKVAVVPPQPIQKVSAAWSFHDANWFFDFPTSAQKLQWFYEKTGGATTDGVIAVTPEILKILLQKTGPIYLEKHQALINAENFIDVLQYEVEVDYDKTLGQPKTILADLGEILIQKFSALEMKDMVDFFSQLLGLIDKKEIMFYFNNPALQQLIESQGWSGAIAKFDGDYLAVVNTNLNGYKTDKVIEQTTNLNIAIQKSGEIKNSVHLIRKHLGGDSIYDWYNRVNTNYLRFYVPQESRLLKASGNTIEIIAPRLDYVKAKFKTDPEVISQESILEVDPNGFFISQEKDKKTFGAWTYVSPKEELNLSIDYLSGFKINPAKPQYQIYLQKQPGMKNQKLNITISYPKNWRLAWSFPQDLKIEKGKISYFTNWEYDEIISLSFESES